MNSKEKYYEKSLLDLFTAFYSFFAMAAQKWGEVSEEILKMTDFPEDPEANAVILFDRGKIEITPDFDLTVQYHKRIKILTEKGKAWADFKIPCYIEDKIRGIEAQTIFRMAISLNWMMNIFLKKKGSLSRERYSPYPVSRLGLLLNSGILYTANISPTWSPGFFNILNLHV